MAVPPQIRYGVIAAILLAFATSRGFAAPPRATQTGTCQMSDAIHDTYSTILARRVHDGWVDYAGLAHDDRKALDGYLSQLSAVTRPCLDSLSRADRFAFWINAYNANTLRLILDHYPVASIRSIGWLPGAAFRDPFIAMPGLRSEPYSLNDLEHGVLRPEFRDARVHFAIVCASKSCPALRSEAYRGADLDRQLDNQAHRFLADATKNTATGTTRVLRLSEIFKWFAEDFERDGGSVAGYVRRFGPKTMADVASERDVKIEFLEYDWSLNGK